MKIVKLLDEKDMLIEQLKQENPYLHLVPEYGTL